MNINLKNAYNMISHVYYLFEHKGENLTKNEVKAILEYAVKKGYESTCDIPGNEVDKILKDLRAKKIPESKTIDDLFI